MKLSKRAHQTIIVLLVFGGFIGLMFFYVCSVYGAAVQDNLQQNWAGFTHGL